MHLTVGTEVGTFIDQDSKRVIELPFTLCLDSFRVEYYPGTEAPADYVSYIRGAEPVSMNRILSRQGGIVFTSLLLMMIRRELVVGEL